MFSAGEIKARSAINYEKMSRLEFRVEAYVDDGYATSALETLKLRIKDVNEEPEFQTTLWTLVKEDEGGVGEN